MRENEGSLPKLSFYNTFYTPSGGTSLCQRGTPFEPPAHGGGEREAVVLTLDARFHEACAKVKGEGHTAGRFRAYRAARGRTRGPTLHR